MHNDSGIDNTGIKSADIRAFIAEHGHPEPSQWFVLEGDEEHGVFHWDDTHSLPMLMNFEFDDALARATYLYLSRNGALRFKTLEEAVEYYRGMDNQQLY